MHDNRAQTEQRLQRFVPERLEPALYRARAPLQVTAWQAPGEPVGFETAAAAEYLPVTPGSPWGPPWATTWFRARGRVPASWATNGGGRPAGADDGLPPDVRLEAVVDLGFTGSGPGFQAEALAYDPHGNPIKGIAPLNRHVRLDAAPGGDVDLWLEAASNPTIEGDGALRYSPTPLGDRATAGSAPLYRLGVIELALLDVTVWELLRDVEMLAGLMAELPTDLPRRAVILRALERMMDVMDPADVAGTAAAGRAELAPALAAPAYPSAHHLTAVGHAHIDSAWLWPVRETMRKCARTFSTVLDLIDEHPDFVFACSSAQQYAWVKERYPVLFDRIRAAVADGRFVPVGGMWVESDTNMPGGEAMARQFTAGQRFFGEEFGITCGEVWLPDSFGYSGALPQIAALVGARYFLTQKISWNQTNRMPHHTFWWQGIDGTRVFTHFPPVDTYNSQLAPAELAHAERTYADHGGGSMSLVPFGFGDGGGGPTREMIARGSRAADLEASPTVEFGTPAEFFAAAEQDYPDAPTWAGEMYLELHRGTYTSQARTKHGNRRSEHLLREAELWAATATIRSGAEYPYERLGRHWRTVLLQQFHDILPGSSIAWVYRDAERGYAELAADVTDLIGERLTVLAGPGELPITFNAAPHPWHTVAALGAGVAAEPEGSVRVDEDGDGIALDNGLLRAVIDRRGLITSLVDLTTGRDAVAPGAAVNLLQLHRDIPNAWDAWDVDEHYRHHTVDLDRAESITVIAGRADAVQPDSKTPADVAADRAGVATVRVQRRHHASTFRQDIALAAGDRSLTLTTTVDWHEQQTLLKLAFPLDVHADRSASETQFGHVFRPTHTNTSWEAAKFEICAHRWIHVGEPGFGVAVANDRVYGHDVTTAPRPGGGTVTTVRQSLLRAPLFPDPEADQGRHVFTTVVTPGADIAAAVRTGYRTNLPGRTVQGGAGVEPLVRVSDPAVLIEAVKLADDRSGDVIVRMYESLGGRARTTVRAAFPTSGVTATDLLERPVDEPVIAVAAGSGEVTVTLRPFQIATLRFARD